MFDDLKSDLDSCENSDSAPAETESNAKRVILGLTIGGILLIALIGSIVGLIISAGLSYNPQKKEKIKLKVWNPYVVTYCKTDNKTFTTTIYLKNNRTAMENPPDPLDNIYGIDINITNKTDNFEPDTLSVSFKVIDEHLFNVKYKDDEGYIERWEIPSYEQNDDERFWLPSTLLEILS